MSERLSSRLQCHDSHWKSPICLSLRSAFPRHRAARTRGWPISPEGGAKGQYAHTGGMAGDGRAMEVDVCVVDWAAAAAAEDSVVVRKV